MTNMTPNDVVEYQAGFSAGILTVSQDRQVGIEKPLEDYIEVSDDLYSVGFNDGVEVSFTDTETKALA